MSKTKELPPLRIRPRPSRILAVFLLIEHGAALAVVFMIPLDGFWRTWLVLLVLAGLAYAVWAQVLYRVSWVGREAIWTSDGTWILTLVSGKQVEARLLPSSLATPKLILLSFRCGRWRSLSMVLPPDALNPDLLRRLRVRLRLRGVGKGFGPDTSM